MAHMVIVWVPPDLESQHHTVPPEDDTAHDWEGATACGLTGSLRWIPAEAVDRGSLCAQCAAVSGTNPPLEGDHPGPV